MCVPPPPPEIPAGYHPEHLPIRSLNPVEEPVRVSLRTRFFEKKTRKRWKGLAREPPPFLFRFFHESCQFFFKLFLKELEPTILWFWNIYWRNPEWMLLWRSKEPHTYTHTHTHTLAFVESQAFCNLLPKPQKGCVALPFTLKSILRQKTNYGNSKYFTMQKNIIFQKKSSGKKPKSFKISQLYN